MWDARGPMRPLLPGLLLVAAITLVARSSEWLLARGLGQAPVDALVLAIAFGIAWRAVRAPVAADALGVDFAGRQLLETSVVLLGASADFAVVARAGLPLALGITGLVALTIVAGSWWGRVLGLTPTQSLLLACGNAICGNSAIAAVAPAIDARREEVASAIAFTAVMGMVLIIALPFAQGPLGLSESQYGVVVGLTVYAVPQVMAAALPIGVHAGQIGMLVKLARVLLLGPVVVVLSLRRRLRREARTGPAVPLVPWFVVGFVVASLARTAGLVPDGIAEGAHALAKILAVMAMASLGLGVELEPVRRAGPRVMVAVTGSLALLLVGGVLLARAVPLP